MFLILAGLIRIILKKTDSKELKLHHILSERFRLAMYIYIFVGGAYLVSALPFFWIDTPIGPLRFAFWYSPFAFTFFGNIQSPTRTASTIQKTSALKNLKTEESCLEIIMRLRPYETHAWMILFLLWTLHLVLSARDFIPGLQDVCLGRLPGALTPIRASTGMNWGQLLNSDPKLATYLASILVDDGISGVLVAIFGMVVTFTSYRKGEKWKFLPWKASRLLAAIQGPA